MSEREEEFWLWRQGEAVEWVSPSSRGKLPSAPPTAFDLDDLPRLRVGYEQPEIGTELGRSTGLADAVCLALSSQRTVRLRLAQDLVDDSGSSWDWTRVPFEWMRHRDAPLHGRVVVERFVPVTAVDPPEAAVPRLDIQVFKRLETNEDLEFTKALSPDGQLPIDDLVVLDEPHCAAAFANPKLDLSRLSALVLVCHGTKADSLRPFRLPDRSSWALPHSHGLPPLVVLLVCGSDAGNLLRYARDALLLSGETQTVIASAGELGLSAAGEFLRQFLRDWSAGRAVHEIVRDAQAALAGKPDGFDARRLCILGRGDLRLETPAGSDWMHPLQELPDSHLAIRIRNRTDKEASALAALANRAALTCLLKRGPSFEEELRRRLGIGARAALAPYLETCLKGAGPGTTGVVQLWNLSWYWLKVLQGQQTQMVDREDFAPYRQDIMPFPAQGETGRASPGFRVDDLPTPLALAWKEVNAALDRQQLVQARPLLQRAFNVTVCFIASVAAMDLLRANTEDRGSPGERADLVEHLFRSPKRLDAEGWVECLRLALRNKGAKRQIDGLRAIAFDGNAKTELMHLLARDYLAWQIEGDEDPGKRTEKLVSPLLFWLERLRRLIETAAESWKGWTFRDGRHSVRWHGTSPEATDAMPALRSNDVSVPLVLEHRDGRKLDLSPLITVLRCSHCRSRKVFLFARRSGTVGAQYFHLSGEHVAKEHVTPLSNVPELGKLFPRRTLEGTHAKSAHTGRIEDEQDALADFDKGEPPQYLFDLLRSACDKLEAGYVGLAAPEGYGKTWFARMYAAECREVPGERVLLYSVGDWRSDVGQFLESLCELASEQLLKGVETAHEQALRQDSASGQFVALVGKLVEVNRLDRLTIIIDGSNELPPASDIDGTTKGERPKASSVIGYLPRATPLPAGVFVVLTGRDEWNFGREGNELKRALKDAGRWVDLHLTPKLAKNIELVRTYVALHVPKQSDVDLVMKLGGGVFLWCRHFVKAIGPGALAEGQDLPEVRTFYPAYLKSLSESDRQVLMRLAAAREPVTQSQLKLWGLSKSQLHDALKKLRDFLSVSDVRTHFSIKHMGLLSYLESDEAMSRHLNATHADIVTRTFDWAQGRWAQLDLTNEDDRYAVKFFPWHIVSAGGQRVLGLAIDECFEGTLRLIERTQATGGLERNDISMALAEAAAGWAIAFAQDRRPRATVGAYIEAIELLSVARIDEAMAYLPKAHLNGGKELEALDDFDQALLSYEKCIESLGDLERVESDGMRDGPYNWSDHSRRVFLSDLPRSREKLAAYDKVIALRGELVAKGRKDVRKALAGSHWGRGLALNKLGRHEEEVVACDAAIALWGELLAEGDKEVREEIARTHRNRAIALVNLGRQEEAVAAYDATIALLAESRKAVREELAYSHHNRATALTKLDRLEEAAAAYGEAIALRGELLAEGRKEVRMDLANSHVYLGLALTNLGRQEEAAAAYGEAIALRRELLAEGRKEVREILAYSHHKRGGALLNLDREEEAAAAFGEAIALRLELLAEGRKEVRMDLATAHHNRGDMLFDLDRRKEAVAAYDEANALRLELLAEGRKEVRIDLANLHHKRASALTSLGSREEAAVAFGLAIALRGELLAEGRKEVQIGLANSHHSRGLALTNLGRQEAAAAAYCEAIVLRGELVAEGRKEVRIDLANSHHNLGLALTSMGRKEEAAAAYSEAIASRGQLVAEGRKEVREPLANSHDNRGNALLQLDRNKEAAVAFGLAIALRGVQLAEGRKEVRKDLANSHHNRGVALFRVGRYEDAAAADCEAIALHGELLAEGRKEVRRNLAILQSNRGMSLVNLGRGEEAVVAYGEAIALHGELLAEGRKEVRMGFAIAHHNRGTALTKLGRLEEAAIAYLEAIALRRELLAEGRKEVREELAYSHHNRATALTKLDRLEEAAAAYGEAIALRGELLAEGRKEVRMDLANSHLYLGLAMTNLGRQEEAAAAYGGAIALRRDLLAEGRKEVRMDLATAHHNRGDALFSLGDHEEAAVAYGEAIALRDKLLAEGRREVRIDLANSHHYRGDALIRVGRHEEAVAAHGEAIALRGELLTEGCKEVRKSLAGSHWSRGLALSKLGRHEEEVVAYDAAIALWGELLTEGDKDVRGDIAGAHSNRAIELVRLGRREEAVAAYEVAIALWGELLAEGRKEVRERLAKLHYDLGDQVLKLDRHKVAAAAFGNAIALWSELLAEGRSEVRVDLSAAHHRRGDILEALGHHQRALMAFDEAIALRSYLLADGNEEVRAALGETHRARGVTLEKLHRHEEAVAAFSEAKALSSGAGRPSQFEPLPPDRRVRKSHTRPKSQPFGD